jgi:hypothetical protein
VTTRGRPDLEASSTTTHGLRQPFGPPPAAWIPCYPLRASASCSELQPAAQGRRQPLRVAASCSGPPPAAQGRHQLLSAVASCSGPPPVAWSLRQPLEAAASCSGPPPAARLGAGTKQGFLKTSPKIPFLAECFCFVLLLRVETERNGKPSLKI